jgi:hypothetical protein
MASGRVQVGQIVSGGLGTPGIAWGSIVAPPTIGALTVYPYVKIFQDRMVYDQNFARSTGAMSFSGSLGSGGSDGKYGDDTHNMALNWIDWMVRKGECAGTSRSEWTRNGPNAARDCIMAHGGSVAMMDQLQQAWREWKASGSSTPRPPTPPADDESERRAACEATGGTWDSATQTCIPSGMEDTGLGTGWWILLALLGAAVGYGIYYYATEK